jgi:hypothetical protein
VDREPREGGRGLSPLHCGAQKLSKATLALGEVSAPSRITFFNILILA